MPTHRSRAPGRVNLIGEHIDYLGLPVLPMALQREVSILLRPRDDGQVTLVNGNEAYAPASFELGPGIEPDHAGAWSNYVKAPAEALARRFAIWRGFDGVVTSDIPVAAGLSSSSALVNAVGLALAAINEVPTEVRSLATLMAEAERYVGTEGGGMDQAVSLGGRAGRAVRIDFHPLRLRHVGVPDDWCFVVADTGRSAEKSGAAQNAYNARRRESEEALRIVTALAATSGATAVLCTSYSQLLAALDSHALLEMAGGALEGNLLRRFRHAVGEAGRVAEAVDRLAAADATGFGQLMDASHASLRTDLQVSCRELDELVTIAREGGAAGARLTGAGFGGCIVALAERWTVGEVLETIVREYLEPLGLVDRIDDRVFVAVPSDGASYGELRA